MILHLVPVRPGPSTPDHAARLCAAIARLDVPSSLVTDPSWRPADADGDGSVSLAMDHPEEAVGLALWVVRSTKWAAVLVADEDSDKSDGLSECPEVWRRHARRAPGRLLVRRALPPGDLDARRDRGPAGPELAAAEATLQLVAALERRRSGEQQAAGRLVEGGASQREAAAELGITQQAVHSRLRHGLWNECRSAAAAVLPLLDRERART